MGRPIFYRQRIRSQVASVHAKTLLNHLAGEIQARREISSGRRRKRPTVGISRGDSMQTP